jgi:cyanophycinase
MARSAPRTKRNGKKDDRAQHQTQTARMGNGDLRPPERTPAPSEQRRPIAGRLIIIGGHEEKEQDKDRVILRHVANCTRGGRVVVCTVASDVPHELWKTYEQTFRGLGCADVVHLDIERRADLLVDPPLDVLKGADVFFFTGGGQLKITTRFAGTRLCAAVEDFYRKGGTVAGTSAGAAAMSDTMLVTGPSRETHKIGETLQMAPGLGFIRDVIIDQHFAERGRIGRLLGAVAQNPRFIGLGIDENTAVVVEKEESFTVLGTGAVYVADAEDITYTNVAEEEAERTLSIFNVRLHVLSQGDHFDLRNRHPTHELAEKAEKRVEAAERRQRLKRGRASTEEGASSSATH